MADLKTDLRAEISSDQAPEVDHVTGYHITVIRDMMRLKNQGPLQDPVIHTLKVIAKSAQPPHKRPHSPLRPTTRPHPNLKVHHFLVTLIPPVAKIALDRDKDLTPENGSMITPLALKAKMPEKPIIAKDHRRKEDFLLQMSPAIIMAKPPKFPSHFTPPTITPNFQVSM